MSITIRHEFEESGLKRDRRLFDPSSVDRVETREPGSTKIVERVNTTSRESKGVYEAEVTGSNYDVGTEYKADWYWTNSSGVQLVTTDSFYPEILKLITAVNSWVDFLIDAIPDYVSCSDYFQNIARVFSVELLRFKKVVNGSLNDATHIETATGNALDRHADEVGIERKANESDAALRQRIIFELRLQRAGGTIDDIQNLLVAAALVEGGEQWDASDVRIREYFGRGWEAYYRITLDLDQILAVGRGTVEDVIDSATAAGVGSQVKSVGEFGYVGPNSTSSDYPEVEGYAWIENGDRKDGVGGRYSGINPR